MAESLERVATIFEAIKRFREEWTLDSTADHDPGYPSTRSARPTSSSSSSSSSAGRGTRSSLSLNLRNRSLRPRSGTQTSTTSLPAPLASLQLRRRVYSVNSSTLSDAQAFWAGGADGSHSSHRLGAAFEGDVAGHGMSNDFVAPLATREPRSRMASDASGGISLGFGSLALAMPPAYAAPAQSGGGDEPADAEVPQQPLKVESQD